MLKITFFSLFDCLYIIESLKKFVKLLGLFLIRCVFTKKLKVKAEDLLKQEPERIKAFRNSVQCKKEKKSLQTSISDSRALRALQGGSENLVKS